MASSPKVLVQGTGFAGIGHAQAFRAAGAEIVGMVGRTGHVADRVAAELGIPYASTCWETALSACDPDIVSIATPGGAHFQPIKQAIARGSHVFCDKPMTATGAEADELYERAQTAGVKTAFAASFRYTASVQHAARLVAEGAIGEPTEIECISHFNLEREIPFGWSHRAKDGGGRLNNNFTHTLSIVTAVIGDDILRVAGDVRDDLGRAPIVKGVHNFTTRRDFIPKNLSDPGLQWGKSDVEWSYTVMAQIQSPLAERPVSVLFKHGGLVPRFQEDHIVFYGTKGAIYLKGHYGSGQLYHYGADKTWTALPLPEDIAASIPDVSGETEQCWHILARLFVRDIAGEDVPAYPTFREGRQYQNIIELIRESDSWTDAPALDWGVQT